MCVGISRGAGRGLLVQIVAPPDGGGAHHDGWGACLSQL